MPLILANIVSITIYYYLAFIAGSKALATKDDSFIGWMVFFELIFHAVVAVVCIGKASGFQNYVYILTFLPFFNTTYQRKTHYIRFFSIILTALGIEFYGHFYPPLYQLDDMVILGMHITNTLFFLMIMGIISFIFFQESGKYQAILRDNSNRDPLTKLFNRRFVISEMETHLPFNRQNGVTWAVILLDIDFFKRINDTYGHNAGDLVLVALAKTLQKNIRADNIVSRWGGEEFLIVCSVADKKNLEKIMQRLRSVAKETAIEYQNKKISFSITLGGAIAQQQESFTELVHRADKALYRGKENGRNQCVIDG